MKDKVFTLLKDGTIYQFVLLFSLILFQLVYMGFNGGKMNDMLIGAIVGVMVGLPVTQKPTDTDKK